MPGEVPARRIDLVPARDRGRAVTGRGIEGRFVRLELATFAYFLNFLRSKFARSKCSSILKALGLSVGKATCALLLLVGYSGFVSGKSVVNWNGRRYLAFFRGRFGTITLDSRGMIKNRPSED